jgi:SAM-dependent methyltransferase
MTKKLKECPITGGSLVDSFTSIKTKTCQPGYPYTYSATANYYFINPIPQDEEIKEFYNGHDAYITEAVLKKSFLDFSNRGRRYYLAQRYARYFPSLPPKASLLDFGSGHGELILFCKENYDLGFSCSIEISSVTKEFFRKKDIKIFKDLEECGNKKFDIITMIDVIEHIQEPVATLSSLKKLLNPGGKIYLRLPVIDGITYNKRKPSHWRWVMSPYHLSMFSIKSIKLLAAKVGLKSNIIIDNDLHADFQSAVERFLPKQRSTPAIFIKLLYKIYPFLIAPILKIFWCSDCVFVILEKNSED